MWDELFVVEATRRTFDVARMNDEDFHVNEDDCGTFHCCDSTAAGQGDMKPKDFFHSNPLFAVDGVKANHYGMWADGANHCDVNLNAAV